MHFLSFFSSLISLIADGPHPYHPACGHYEDLRLPISPRLTPCDRNFIAIQVQHPYNSSSNGRILPTYVLTLSATEEITQKV